MKVRLDVIGEGTLYLVQWLESQGWEVHEWFQTSSLRGYVIGTHPNPMDFLGDGINDGTRIHAIGLVQEPEQEG